jgi:putative transposase
MDQNNDNDKTYIIRDHQPLHLFVPNQLYIVTAGTYNKEAFFNTDRKIQIVEDVMFGLFEQYRWIPQAWALFPNHYHFIAQAPDNPGTLSEIIRKLHSKTAVEINKLDECQGRKIWYQYFDTCITYEKSYFARLKYVTHNPTKHGYVINAIDYRFCSAINQSRK